MRHKVGDIITPIDTTNGFCQGSFTVVFVDKYYFIQITPLQGAFLLGHDIETFFASSSFRKLTPLELFI